MLPSNRKFLDHNRHYVESYSKESPPGTIGYNDRRELLRIVREEFDSNYTADLWCGECIKILVLNAYALYDEKRK